MLSAVSKTKAFFIAVLIAIAPFSKAEFSTTSLPAKSTKAQLEPNYVDKLTLQRNQFIQAENFVKSKNISQFKVLRKQLNDYPLVDYLDALALSHQLSNHQAIDSFLSEKGGVPATRRLRHQWLTSLLNGKNNELFLKHFRPTYSKKLNCHYLTLKLDNHTNRKVTLKKIEQLWLSATSLPKTCDRLISAWKKLGPIPENLVWERMTLVLKANNKRLFRYLKRSLSPINAKNAELLAKAYKNPNVLKSARFIQPLTPKAEFIITTALEKLAWKNPTEAASIWQYLSINFDYRQNNNPLRRAIALSLAIDKAPEALKWLNSLAHLNDPAIDQWLLSTAIEQENWQLVASHSRRLAQSDTSTFKWIYWRAAAEQHLGNETKAKSLWTQAASHRSYYGFLSAKKLGLKPVLSNKPTQVLQSKVEKLSNKPEARRAYEFYQMGRFTEARTEWNQLRYVTPQSEQVELALLADQWGWRHQSILAFAQSKQIDDIQKRFPLDHFDIFTANAEKHQIPVSWAFAITRQESAFKQDARSSANARGLMQLKPSTARHVAKRIGGYRKASELYAAKTNISLGTAHLADMYRQFDQHPVLATAAYNAGKSRVDSWLEKRKMEQPVQWIEQIPYKETREYVKNVLTYQLIYAELTEQIDSFIYQLDNLPKPSIRKVAATLKK